MTSQPQVLIVGAGPSGLILALTLLKNGIPVRIIEKSPLPRIGQRGPGLMPRSLELFEFLGILDSVMQRSIGVPHVKVYKSPEGVEILKEFESAPTLEPTPAIPYPNPRLLGQQNLENIIQTEMKKYNCSVELGVKLVDLEQFDDRVEVKLHKRNTENSEVEEESSKYEWVVGADGAKGVIRKLLGLTFLGETRAQQSVVGDIRVEGLTDGWHIWGDFADTGLVLRVTEIPGLFSFLIGGMKLDNIGEIAASEDAIRASLRKMTSNRADLTFGEIECYSIYRINIRMVDKFGKGRVFVAGDAAHVHSPTGGQGMNTGIQDSFNLGWKLAHVVKGFSSPSLLNTYTEERVPVVTEMLDLTAKILKKTVDDSTSLEAARKRARNTNQLGVNCRWSSIVVDQNTDSGKGPGEREVHSAYDVEVGDVMRAGDRAPDASGLVKVKFDNQKTRDSTRLFKLMSPKHHTVLIFSAAADISVIITAIAHHLKDLVRVVVLLRAGTTNVVQDVACDIFEDSGGHAYDAYRGADARANGIVVIRPDGVIGAIVKDVDWMERYFRAILVDSQ